MRTRTSALLAVSALAVSLGITAGTAAGSAPPDSAGAAASGGSSITVGSANFPENELLAQIYGQKLAAAGFDVSFELNVGNREVLFPALEKGEIHVVAEYTNSLLAFVTDPDAAGETVEEQVALLGENLPDGVEVLTPSTAEDKDVIVCTADAAEQYGLVDLTSLAAASADITLGGPPEFEDRSPFGVRGLSEELGAEFKQFVPLAIGDIPAALSEGEIDCGNLFSTDPAITNEGFVALDDDLGLVAHEAVLPLVRSDIASPELVAELDAVSAALDTEILTELVAQVVTDARGADEVAAEWLASDPQPVAAGSADSGAPVSS